MDIVFITGANSSYFLMACLLMESVGEFASQCAFFVLDFGLSESERQYLRSRNALLAMPDGISGVSAESHPYFLKTAAIHYLKDISTSSAVVWIDSDIVIGSDLTGPLAHVLKGMEAAQSSVAACREGAIADVLGQVRLDMGPFEKLLKARGMPSTLPYFNSGFVVFRSRDILANWFNLASVTPLHALFDQNILNVLMHDEGRITALPQEDWNLHGDLLAESALGPLLGRGTLPKILHATSSHPDHIDVVSMSLTQDFGRDYPVRFFRNPILRRHQFEILTSFIQKAFPETGNGAAFPRHRTQLKISRNAPCPCNSGKRYKACHGSLF